MKRKNMLLNEATYTVFDVETTGLFSYYGDKICEIGAVRLETGKPGRIFQSFIDPQRSISYGAFKVNGITRDMVKGKPTIDKILPDFLNFAEGSVLVAYNSGFDLGFVENALGSNDYLLEDFQVIDALRLARRLFPAIDKYNLGRVAESLGFSTDGQHRALSDAMITAKIFKKELELLKAEGVETVEEISENRQAKEKIAEIYNSPIVEIIEAAIQGQENLNITYRSAWNNKDSNRTITPKEIRKGYDRLYILGYCHLRKEERNFRVDSIVEAKIKETDHGGV